MAALGAIVAFGCGPDLPEGAVASMDGWVLDEDGLAAEYDRVAQLDARKLAEASRQPVEPASYLNATPQERLDFARLLLDKELLLRLAREACPEPDSIRQRRVRVLYEKRLVNGFLDFKRRSFRVSPEEGEQVVQALSRRVRVTRAEIPEANRALVQQEMVSGGVFDEVARKYAAGGRVEQAALDFREFSADMAGSIFLADLPAGRSFGPVEMRTGTFFFRVDGFEPFALADDPELRALANRMVDAIVFFPRNRAWVDSLQSAAQIGFHRENFPLVQRYFAAFWDSVETERLAGAAISYQSFRSPTWLVPADERDTPLYDLWGQTHSVHAFMRSLDDVDLDLWPTTGDLDRIAFKIEGRVIRLLWVEEAQKTGYTESAEFQHEAQQLEEKELLDQYRFRHLIPQLTFSDEDVRREYEDHPDLYRSTEQVAFGLLLFPPGREAEARAAYLQVKDADPLRWYEVGPVAAQEPGVVFEADTGLAEITQPLEHAEWAPFREIARQQEVGQLSDLISTPHGFAIVRTNQLVPSRRLTFDESKTRALQNLQSVQVDSVIEAKLTEARERWNGQVYPRTLGIVESSG